MNNVIDNMINRRSIRSYQKKKIPDRELQTVLEAGRYAANAMGRQAVKLVVVQNEEVIDELRRMNAKIMGTDSDPYYGAPAIIIVFSDSSFGTYIEDGSCAMQNMLNAAFSVGLGSCWIHRERQMFESERGKTLKKEWGVPESYAGIGACALGYPACAQPEAAPRKEDNIIFIR